MTNHIIYKLTFPNNKIDIGQTIQKFNIRMNQYKTESYNKSEKNKKYNRLISKAIRKYGWNNVKKEILCTVSEEFVDDAERYFIKKYNSTNKNFGYNLEDGGNKNKHHSEEIKKKMSKIRIEKGLSKGKNNPNYGKGLFGENHPMFGVHRFGEDAPNYGNKHSEETKQLMKKTRIEKGLSKGENNPMYGKKRFDVSERNKKKQKSVDAFIKKTGEYVGTFESIKQAGIKLNLFSTNISAVLNKKLNHTGGYDWRYTIG